MPAIKHADALVYSSHQVVLSDISYTSFTYPGDQEALAALKAIPGAGPLPRWATPSPRPPAPRHQLPHS